MSGRYSFAVQAGSTICPILRSPSAMSGGTWALAVAAMARTAAIVRPETNRLTLTVLTPRRRGTTARALGRYGLHGVGSPFFAPSASFLKCVLVTTSCVRYFGSETTVVT